MNPLVLRGTFTALVTPFTASGAIDYGALERLVQAQIDAGIEGVVILGTTGESPTITAAEQAEILRFVVRQCAGRTLVIAGTGSNSTEHCIECSRQAAVAGVDALLIVNPYYNKPTQEGLLRHFSAVAGAVDLPQILYNIRGRTGVNIDTPTLLQLAGHHNIIGVKEASGDLPQMMEVLADAPAGFAVLSGDDNLTFPLLMLGGHGVISVLSNLVPAAVKEMVDAALRGDLAAAKAQHFHLLPLMRACFLETNPIPVKTALALQGTVQEIFRLPMCPMSEVNRKKLHSIMHQYHLLS